MSFSGEKGYLTKPKPGVMLNPLHPLSQGLVGYWLFNEGSGSKAYDISGNGNHGTLTNILPNVLGSGWGGSMSGGGVWCDGSNDYIDCGNDSSLSFGTNDFAISLWIYEDKVTASYPSFIGKGDTGAGEWMFRDDGANQRLSFYGDGGSINTASGNNIIKFKTWQHIVASRIGSTLKLYMNGSVVAQDTSAGADLNNGTSLRIGSADGDPNRWWDGAVDFVQMYNNRGLQTSEVKQLYHNPFCNLLQIPLRRYSVVAPPVGVIMNQFQTVNLGADLYQGAIIA